MDFQPNTKLDKRIWLSLGKSIFCLMPIIALFLVPTTTQAGVFSFLTDLFSGQDVSAQSDLVIEASSQTMTLPEPAINFDPSVKLGGEVVMDGGEALLSEAGPSNDAPDKIDNSNGQVSIYVVRSGDTLADIAKMFDVSVNTILWANDMTRGSALKVGQTLVILPISGVMHTVVKGDTLSSIAKKYGGDVTEIAQFNDFVPDAKLIVGDTILIPDGQVSTSITGSRSGGTASYSAPNYNSYYTQPFPNGPKIHRTQGLHGYRNSAVDWGMPVGTRLSAAAAGTVIISRNSGWNGGYGNYVIIQHPNNTQTIYGHMSSTIVSVGQHVSQGQLIGYSGNSGNSTGPHLHLEVRGAKNPF
jgi:murein DD-endopeptidase MepM/ murein hydrolase activator NlpD